MPPHLRLDRRMCGVGGRRCGCGRVLLLDRDHLHRQMEPGELWFAFAIADHHHPGAGLKRVAAAAVSDKTHIKPSRSIARIAHYCRSNARPSPFVATYLQILINFLFDRGRHLGRVDLHILPDSLRKGAEKSREKHITAWRRIGKTPARFSCHYVCHTAVPHCIAPNRPGGGGQQRSIRL